ncbi:outer membrane beta-barrel protein [Pedobacter sp. WC2501]|uniref:outer membrane beta-barrel protein n=1 Tax=Pedobacter sp. WC2501 TaxID=3461400 RepID=UPI0040465DB3
MKSKIIIAVIVFITGSISVKAQKGSTDLEKKWIIDIGGSIGLFIPFHQPKNEDMILGTTTNTSVQFNYEKHYFARLEFGQISVGFRDKSVINGINSDINSSTNSLNIGLGLGYQYRIRKWQPFIYGGGGPSYVTVPEMSFDKSSNTVSYRTNSTVNGQLNLGVGVNYYLSRSIILLLETKASSVLGLPKQPNANLSGISALVNVKIAL